METALLLAGKIIQLTLIVLMGFALVKFKLLKSENSRVLSIITLYLISPSVMITSFQIDYTPNILHGLLLSLGLAIVFHILLITIGKLLKHFFHLNVLEHAAMVYTNSGNLIIPIVMSVFGPEWVVYTSGFIMVQMFLFWTHLRMLICGASNLSWKQILSNVNIISMLISLTLFALHIKLPALVNGTLHSVAIMIGPVAMMVAGMLIAALPLKSIVLSKRIYLIALLRLIVIPLILLLVIKLVGVTHWGGHSDKVTLISFLAVIAPSAATITQMAVVYEKDSAQASAIYGVTTLFCVLTMPLMIGLYQWLV